MRAVQLKPHYAEAWVNLATDYLKVGKSAEALAAAQKALSIARAKGQTSVVQDIEAWLSNRQALVPGTP